VAGLDLKFQKIVPALAWRGYDNFDPSIMFCAFSMKNIPGGSEIHQDDFRTKLKVLPSKTCFGDLGCLW
jgi:hypothetical protein